jgi:hypothetical protein
MTASWICLHVRPLALLICEPEKSAPLRFALSILTQLPKVSPLKGAANKYENKDRAKAESTVPPRKTPRWEFRFE